MSEFAGSIRINVDLSAKKVESELASLEAKMIKLTAKVRQTTAAMKELEQTKVHTKEYAELEKKLGEANKELSELRKQEEQMEKAGLNFGAAWDDIIEKEVAVADRIDDIKSKMQAMEDSGKRFIDQTQTEEYKKLADNLKICETELEAVSKKAEYVRSKMAQTAEEAKDVSNSSGKSTKTGGDTASDAKDTKEAVKDTENTLKRISDIHAAIVNKIKETTAAVARQNEELNEVDDNARSGAEEVENAQKKVRKAVDQTNKTAERMHKSYDKGAKKTSKLMRHFASRMREIITGALIFNWISGFFTSLTNGIKDTFTELASVDKEAGDALSELRQSTANLSAAFMSMLAPALITVMPIITDISNGLADAMTKAGMMVAAITGQSTYRQMTKDASKAAGAVSSIGDAAKKTQGKLAGFDDIDILVKDENNGLALEEMEIDPEIAEQAGKINEVIDEMSGIIPLAKAEMLELGQAFKAGFNGSIGSNTAGTLDEIRLKAQEIQVALADIFTDPEALGSVDRYVDGVAETLGSIAGIGVRIGIDLGDFVVGSISDFLKDHKDRISESLADIFDAKSLIMDKVRDGLGGIGTLADTFVTPEAKKIGNSVLGIFSDVGLGLSELFAKMSSDAVDLFITPFSENTNELAGTLTGVYDSFSDISDGLHSVFESVMDSVNDTYDSSVGPALQSIRDDLSNLIAELVEGWNQYIQPVIDEFGEKLGPVLKEKVAPAIVSVVECIGSLIAAVLDIASALTPFVSMALSPFLDLLGKIGGAVGNSVIWVIEKICELLKLASEELKGFFEGVSDKADALKEKFSWLASAKDAAASIFGGANSAQTVATYSIDTASLPHYADGAVIRGGNPYLAIVGDQPYGQTNVETPMSTMLDAFRAALDEWKPRGGGGTVVLELDGRELARAELDYITEEAERRGIELA